MSIRRTQWQNIKGNRVEESVKHEKPEDRHFHREAKSQKAQLDSSHHPGNRKDIKTPIEKKLT